MIADAFVERFILQPTGAGPLSGTSFAVKDIIDVAGHHTGCGNPSWRATHAPALRHAAAVHSLLAAGARLCGKTRTDELAYALDGRNLHEGAPLNPAHPQRLTGGSSSGSAAAVAGSQVDFALGTDTAGSVRVPAAWCGLAGIRPTHGRVSAGGVVPLAPSFDVLGWFARSLPLLRRVGGVLLTGTALGPRECEVLCDPAIDARAPGYRPPSREGPLPRVSLDIDLQRAAETLRILQGAEAWASHGAWIEAVRPHFGPGIAERFAAARAIGASEVQGAAQERAAILARLDQRLPPGKILCLPSVPAPAPRRDAGVDELQSSRAQIVPLTALASLSGRPQLSVPLPAGDQECCGFSLLGWRGGDEALLAAAQALVASASPVAPTGKSS